MKEYRFENIAVGTCEQFQVDVTSRSLDLFREMSGDINPLHCEDVFAVRSGFKGRVAYGMLTASYYSTLAGVYLPGRHCLLHGLDISFHEPVYIGDTLTIKGTVSYINEAFKQFEIKAEILNQLGKKVSKATIKAGVRD